MLCVLVFFSQGQSKMPHLNNCHVWYFECQNTCHCLTITVSNCVSHHRICWSKPRQTCSCAWLCWQQLQDSSHSAGPPEDRKEDNHVICMPTRITPSQSKLVQQWWTQCKFLKKKERGAPSCRIWWWASWGLLRWWQGTFHWDAPSEVPQAPRSLPRYRWPWSHWQSAGETIWQ